MNDSDLHFVDKDSEEWRGMWDCLYTHEKIEKEEPNGCECWEYLGTESVGNPWHTAERMVGSERTDFAHTFRHRRDPKTGERKYLYVYASRGYSWIDPQSHSAMKEDRRNR